MYTRSVAAIFLLTMLCSPTSVKGQNLAQPFLMLKIPGTPPDMYAALNPTDVILDHVFMAAPPIKSDEWLSYYAHILKNLSPGVSEIIVHLAYDDAEMQAVT